MKILVILFVLKLYACLNLFNLTIELLRVGIFSEVHREKSRCSLFLVLSAKSLYFQLSYLLLHRRPLKHEDISNRKLQYKEKVKIEF